MKLRSGWILLGIFLCFISFNFMPCNFLGCKSACDKPGAVCQDPRFVGGDGILFYFHGKKDKDFCLVSDPLVHINAHFIGKKSNKKVAKWKESIDNILIRVNEENVIVPDGKGQTWWSGETRVMIQRQAEMNKVRVKVEGLFEIAARVVPITMEESRVHGYDVEDDDCFAHLELNFKFYRLSKMVDGVLGQTYRPGHQSRVKMAADMPIMGGTDRFASSHLFATDCAVSNFGLNQSNRGWRTI